MRQAKPFILMLEDDTDDRYITESVLAESGIDVSIKYFCNSEVLFQFLSSSERPSLILVDYNSTPENGLEILKKIKSKEEYKAIPVIILTDSTVQKYVHQCYAHGASSVIKKPETIERTKSKINTFFRYWFEVTELDIH